jgi:uncharacterized membrane protein
MNVKDLTQSLISLVIIVGAVVSLFVPVVNEAASQTLRILAGGVVGFYFGAGTVPSFGFKRPSA